MPVASAHKEIPPVVGLNIRVHVIEDLQWLPGSNALLLSVLAADVAQLDDGHPIN